MVEVMAGIRVVDFGTVLAGAIPGQLMSDMGAEVIKVESKERVDYMRLGRPIIGDKPDFELNPMFMNINRGKLGITANITHPKACNLLKELIKKSDIVVENFTPTVMGRVGLGYSDLVKIKPDIIVLSMPAAGSYGPLSELRAYAPTVNALSGIDSMTGYKGSRPLGIKMIYGDICSALHGIVAVMSALHYRKKTGVGDHIDLSMWEASTVCVGEGVMEYVMAHRVLDTQGNYNPMMAPHNFYRCKGEDQWVSIAIDTEEEWKSFCNAIGNPNWTREERFADKFKRLNNLEALDRFITEWTSNYTPYEVMDKLQKNAIAAVPHMSAEMRFCDAHYKDRQTYVSTDHPRLNGVTIYNQAWKMSETPGRIRRPAPMMGEHNNYVYGELLGLSSDEIKQLEQEQVLY